MSAYFLTASLLGADPNTVNWRRIFIILGITGVILAFIVKIIIREPQRGAMESGNKQPSGYISIRKAMEQADLPPRYMLFGSLSLYILMLWQIGGQDIMRLALTAPLIFSLVYIVRRTPWYVQITMIAAYAAIIAIGWHANQMNWLIVALGLPLVLTMFLLSLQPGVMTILKIKSWWWMALGIAFASFASYAVSGFQTKFLRLLDPEFNFRTIIIWIGIINGTFYVAGTYFGAKLVDWRAKKDIRAYGTIPAISILLAFPLAIAALRRPWLRSTSELCQRHSSSLY